jgi:putative membrane protein
MSNLNDQQQQLWAKFGLLLSLGLYFGYVLLSGIVTNYINYRFTWLVWLGAAILLGFAAVTAYELWQAYRTARADALPVRGNHTSITWAALGVAVIPLALGVLVPSQPLGAGAVDGDIRTFAVAGGDVLVATGDPLKWNILEWLRAFNRSDNLASFNGRQANVIGFVYREPSFPEGQFMIARFTISCCVADSSAIGLPVVWAEEVPIDQWVNIQGTFELGDFRGEQVPLLVATQVERIDQPEHPYIYP